jgi:hypothetical protein
MMCELIVRKAKQAQQIGEKFPVSLFLDLNERERRVFPQPIQPVFFWSFPMLREIKSKQAEARSTGAFSKFGQS